MKKNNINFLIVVLCYTSLFFGQNRSTHYLMTKQKKPIEFASIYFREKGTYSNEIGKFEIEIIKHDTLYVTAIGYKLYKVSTVDLADTIFLSNDTIALKEVYVKKEKAKKCKTVKNKVINYNNFLHGFRTSAGDQIAVFVENKYSDYRVKLNNITIPLYLKSINTDIFSKAQVTRKKEFKTFFKLNFYTNNDGKPGELMNEKTLILKIDEHSMSNFKIDLINYNVFLPYEGCFIVIENIGEKNQNSNTFKLDSDYITEANKLVLPEFQISDKINGNYTFYKNSFKFKNVWYDVTSLNITPLSKNYSHKNIGIGYELELYE